MENSLAPPNNDFVEMKTAEPVAGIKGQNSRKKQLFGEFVISCSKLNHLSRFSLFILIHFMKPRYSF